MDSVIGKVLVLMWSVYCLFLAMFYTSNLRAYLIAPEYEPYINTPRDAIERGSKIYMPKHYRFGQYFTRI